MDGREVTFTVTVTANETLEDELIGAVVGGMGSSAEEVARAMGATGVLVLIEQHPRSVAAGERAERW